MKLSRHSQDSELESRTINVPFYNMFNRPPVRAGERNAYDSKTATLGYIDHVELIGEMLKAGENLASLRDLASGQHYDAPASTSPEDMTLPHVRKRGFDLVDFGKLREGVTDYLKTMSSIETGANITATEDGSAASVDSQSIDTPDAATAEV